MHSRISIKNSGDGWLLFIRPPEGRLMGLIVLAGLLWLLATDQKIVPLYWSHGGLTHALPVGLTLFALIFNIWQFFGGQRIGISESEIQISKMVGWMRFGKIRPIRAAFIDAISIQERKYRSRGHYYVLYRIAFLSKGQELGCTSLLSAHDCELLLNGPFARFKRCACQNQDRRGH
jgi:hypothetical protein